MPSNRPDISTISMNYLYIADFSAKEIPNGGAELCDSMLIEELEKENSVKFFKSSDMNPEILAGFDGKIIVSNFYFLSDNSKKALSQKDYVIYEHDHKYLPNRNPSIFPGLVAPKQAIINRDFYAAAKFVICQTARHANVVESNLGLDNIISAGGNLWSEESLDKMESLLSTPKKELFAVLQSNNPIKNFHGSVKSCQAAKIPFEIIPPLDYFSFLERLASYKGLVFIPLIFETLSRVCVEAKCLDLEIVCNNNISFMFESWSKLRGKDCIDYIRYNNKQIVNLFKW